MKHISKMMKALIGSLVLLLMLSSLVTVASGTCWTEIGIGNPIIDKNGNPGYVYSVTFADKDQPNLLTGIVGPVGAERDDVACRPATSTNQAVSWVVHDSPNFDQIETQGWGDNWRDRVVARSAANPNRIWFAANGHPWYSPAPKGGLWRSDDNGTSWTENLMAGQPGESGEINSIIPDPDDQDKVFIGRGYDYGNVSVSTDAGVTFTILQGHNNVSKTGDDRWNYAVITIDFVVGLILNKHDFLSPMSMNLDGSNSTEINFPGVIAGRPLGGITYDVPVRGLQKRAGGLMGRCTADGGFIYSAENTQTLYYAAGGVPDVSSAVPINGVNIDFPDGYNLLAHPTEPCTWVVQTGGTTFSITHDCGVTWSPLPMDGFTSTVRVVAMAYLPDASGRILAFTEDGRRFLFSVPCAVTLLSFNAKSGNDGSVILTWETATEVDNAGFNLYRAETKDGAYKKINDILIPAQGNATSGAGYSFVDTPPAKGTYYYKLEDVDYKGVSAMHGPEKVKVRSDDANRL